VKLSVIVLLLLAVAWAVCLTLAADDKDKLGAGEIINRHIAAVGGKETLAKIKSRVAIGVARKDNDAAAPVSVMSEAPNRVSAIYQFEGFNWQLTYDGSKSIVRPLLSRAAAPVMHKYEDMLATGTMFNDISLYNALTDADSSNVKFEAKGLKKLKGRPAYAVEMKRGKDKALLYFDAENFMWVRTEYGSVSISAGATLVGPKDQEATYDFYLETSDFKDVDGVKLPFRFEIVGTAPILKQKSVGTIAATINEYRHNIAIDPKMFQ
jgi:hypothetical protein